MVTRLKRQTTELEKIFASYTSDKGLITRKYKKFKKLPPKIIDPIRNGQTNGIEFFKGRNPNVQKTRKEMLNITGHKENENQKPCSDSTSLLLEWLSSKTQRTNVSENVGEKEPSYTIVGN
jgi:hypothetical protein